jgi:hypothetical protein
MCLNSLITPGKAENPGISSLALDALASFLDHSLGCFSRSLSKRDLSRHTEKNFVSFSVTQEYENACLLRVPVSHVDNWILSEPR